MRQHNKAFTIVELLVVIAIIGLLISLLLPAIQAAREYARRSRCAGNMKQMAVAMLTYHDAIKSFPSGNILHQQLFEASTCHAVPPVENELIYCGSIGWATLILPYLEQSSLYDRIHFDKLAYLPAKADFSHHNAHHGDPDNIFAATNMPDVFACPSSKLLADPHTHKDYGVNGCASSPERRLRFPQALFHGNSGNRLADVKRGTTNTFMILEVAHAWPWAPEAGHVSVEPQVGANPFFWLNSSSHGYVCYGGRDHRNREDSLYTINKKNNWIPTRLARSYHPTGINVALCDGSVTFITEKMDYDNYKGLFPIDGPSVEKLP